MTFFQLANHHRHKWLTERRTILRPGIVRKVLARHAFLVTFILLTCAGITTALASDLDLVLNTAFPANQSAAENGNSLIETLSSSLIAKDKQRRLQAVREIAESASPARGLWLKVILDGKMFQRKSDKRMVIATSGSKEVKLIYATDGNDAGVERKRKLKKVSLNNAMRSEIKDLMSTLDITSPDVEKRRAATSRLLGSTDGKVIDQLRTLQTQETDLETRTAMLNAIAVFDLQSEDKVLQQAALETAGEQLHPEFLNSLRKISEQTDNKELKTTVDSLIAKAERKKKFYGWVETLFFGVSLGSVLTLAAIGLAITFGVMGVINMAHGELIMLGAYTTYFIQQLLPNHINYSLMLAIPAAFIVSGIAGILIERLVIRHLYGRALETLLATFGISLLLQQLVRTTVSSQNVAVVNPDWLSGSIAINPLLSLTVNRIAIVGFCLIVFFLLFLLMNKSSLGLQIRAVSQNRRMARALGIRSSRIDALTFGLGSGIAGIAGVALSQIGNVGPNLGQGYIIDSFLVVVFGGVGNLWGTLVAGMSLGITNKVLEPFAGAVLAKILLLVLIILFIQKRPRGLFPQRGRAVEA